MAVGSMGTILTSSDGSSWTSGRLPSDDTIRSVVHDGTRCVATTENDVWLSTDAQSWAATASFPDNALVGVALHDDLFIVVGNDALVASSPDGVSWTELTTFIDGAMELNPAGVVSGNGRLVIVAWDSSHYSDDLISWTQQSIPEANPLGITFQNGNFHYYTRTGLLVSSSDGGS